MWWLKNLKNEFNKKLQNVLSQETKQKERKNSSKNTNTKDKLKKKKTQVL